MWHTEQELQEGAPRVFQQQSFPPPPTLGRLQPVLSEQDEPVKGQACPCLCPCPGQDGSGRPLIGVSAQKQDPLKSVPCSGCLSEYNRQEGTGQRGEA